MSLTNTKVTSADLDKCHRMQKETVVIMEFKTRTMRDKVVMGRKLLKDKEEMAELGLRASFINESLCPEYRKLDYLCRTMKKKGIINDTWFFNGRLFVMDNAKKKWFISHINDITEFVDIDTINQYLK